MKRLTILLFLLSVSQLGHAVEFRNGVGLGFQYSGVGWQGGIRHGNNSVKLSMGAIGSSFGYEYAVSKNLSLASHYNIITTPLYISTTTAVSLHANYHFSGNNSSGLLLGLDLMKVDPLVDDNGQDISGTEDLIPFISIGYQF